MECPNEAGCGGKFSKKGIDKLIGNETNIVTILHNIQSEYNHLPKNILEQLSEKINIPLSHLYRLATFYKAFSLKPKGNCHLRVCKGTACHVREAQKVVDKLESILGIKGGEATKDLKFSLETVNCLGVCALGPVVVINEEYFGQMTPAKAEKLIKEYKEK